MGLLRIPQAAVVRASSAEHFYVTRSADPEEIVSHAIDEMRKLDFRVKSWGKSWLRTRANGTVAIPPDFGRRASRARAVSLHHELGHVAQRRKLGNLKFTRVYAIDIGGWWWLEAQCYRMSLDADVAIRMRLGETLAGVVEHWTAKMTGPRLYPLIRLYDRTHVEEVSKIVLEMQLAASVWRWR